MGDILLYLSGILLLLVVLSHLIKSLNGESNVENKVDKNETPKKEQIRIDTYYSDFIDVGEEEYILKYSYKQELCFNENFDSFQLRSPVTFKLEPDNQYDPDTVAVYVEDKKIGLMYKGDAREIVISCLKRNKFHIDAFVNYRDVENQKSGISIGFYTTAANKESFVTSIIKTSKKDEATEEKRYDRLELMSEGDSVELEESYDTDCIIVTDGGGYELGEISESAAKKVEQFGGVRYVVAKICEINDEDYEKLKFKIRIYSKR